MRKAFQVLFLAMVFSLCLSFPSWAALKWEDPDVHPTPSCYAGREYTRQHWVDFFVDEYGTSAYSVNRAHARPLFSGYCSVFDLPPSYSRGYTAVGDNDGVAWDAAMILDALGVPDVDGWWIVSPAFWREKYGSAPQIFGGSELLSVPVTTVKNSSGLTPGFDTIADPKCFKNGPAGGFEAGGYQVWYYNGKEYEQGWHWYSRESKSPVSITRKYASKMWKADVTTRAEISFNYIYGLSAAGVQPQGSPSGGKQTWQATFYNTTPFVAKDVSLRAYVVQDGKYTLAAQTSTDIGPLPLGNGIGGVQTPTASWSDGQGVSRSSLTNTITWTFQTFVPSGQYRILVSANVDFSGGSGRVAPLTTEVAYGHQGLSGISGLTGTKYETAAGYPAPNPLGLSQAYGDNCALSGEQSYTPNPPPGEAAPNDLAVTDIKVLDEDKNPAGTTLQEGKTYYVRATFQSGFDAGGFATIRLYRYDASQKRMYDCGSEYAYFSPKGTVTKDFGGFGWGAGSYTLIATVDYYNNGNDPSTGWKAEKFDGKYEESTYDNNRKDLGTGLSEAPPELPQPRYWSYNLYYPPVVTKTVPVYKTVYTYEWRDRWIGPISVIFEEVNGKVKVRLAPNGPPSPPGD
ncbi:MAG: hypothetical protein AB1426_05065 [Bacillota bacterium]